MTDATRGRALYLAIGFAGLALAIASIADMFSPRPYDGIVPVPYSRGGIAVRAVVPGGPAEVAGIRAGDCVLGPAALLVSTVHAAIYLQIDASETIVELVSRIDRHLQRFSATHKFLTLFFGIVEPDAGLLRFVCAGHNPALLARGSGPIERLSATGVPLGLVPNGSWTEESVSFGPGDLLCVYTDGFTEAANADDEEFGLERLEQELTSRPRPSREGPLRPPVRRGRGLRAGSAAIRRSDAVDRETGHGTPNTEHVSRKSAGALNSLPCCALPSLF